ncbi:MAG: four helix bundle protein [Candidatus Hydrogenedentota bacterium]
MNITKFEEIKAWQIARNIVNTIYKITHSYHFDKDFTLREQIRRAGISVMSNIAEGFDRGSDKEFVHFLFIARGSISEIKSQDSRLL